MSYKHQLGLLNPVRQQGARLLCAVGISLVLVLLLGWLLGCAAQPVKPAGDWTWLPAYSAWVQKDERGAITNMVSPYATNGVKYPWLPPWRGH